MSFSLDRFTATRFTRISDSPQGLDAQILVSSGRETTSFHRFFGGINVQVYGLLIAEPTLVVLVFGGDIMQGHIDFHVWAAIGFTFHSLHLFVILAATLQQLPILVLLDEVHGQVAQRIENEARSSHRMP